MTPRSHPLFAFPILAASLLLIVAASHGRAQPDALRGFVGRYRNVAADGGRAHITSQVDAGTASMRALRRSVARRRIIAGNPPVPTLEIHARPQGAVEVVFAGARAYSARIGGALSPSVGPDGSDVRVRFRWRGARLVERIEAGQGHSVNTYALSRGGSRLTLVSTMHSRHLPAPITYTLRFTRQ